MQATTTPLQWALSAILLLGLAACNGASEAISSSPSAPANPVERPAQEPASIAATIQAPAVSATPKTAMTSKRSKSGFDITPLTRDQVAELAKDLPPEIYRITQNAGTEPAFCGDLVDNKLHGTYACVVCGLPLFSSDSKFDSGTGWPSFFQPVDPEHVAEHSDVSRGMKRTEILCERCTAHLGHVFEDGPRPTGLRYCLNSASMQFYEKGTALPALKTPLVAKSQASSATPKTETAYFAGGCFWGIEHYFQLGAGVISAESGYMQGRVEKPSYKQVCYEQTGHAEAVKVVFDPSVISYERLLEAFFVMHDPTQLNYQGPDHGDQYRSGIYTVSPQQAAAARAAIAQLASSGRFGGKKIVTEVEAAKTFWPAEDYHQDYIAKTGRACHVKDPWKAEAGAKH
jgi:peptide methionine sulfoxide reductase msrA/msrB